MSTVPDGTSQSRRVEDLAGRHKTLSEFVLDELRKRIVLGYLAPGTRLAVDEVADELGSSRIPVREALRQLEAEGLIEGLPRRGVKVREMCKQDIDDAYGLLEAAELLAVHRATNKVSDAMLQEMHYWSDEMVRLFEAPPDPEAMLIAHRSFHFVVFDAIGEGLLLRHTKMLWNSCERFVMAAISDSGQRRENIEQHKEYIPLFKQKDTVGLTNLTRKHLEVSRQRAHHALNL